jgi:hypothetical protein
VNVTEGYKDSVPSYCLTAGTKFSKGYVQFIQGLTGQDISTWRVYTPSECNKLKGGVYESNNGRCYKLKNNKKNKNDMYDTSSDNVDISYHDKCGGLNKLPVTIPQECSIDDNVLGKMSKAFSINREKPAKPLVFDNNGFRIYTENECDKFKGKFTPMADIIKELKGTKEDTDNFEKINGSEYGFCQGDNGLALSMICGTDEAPGAASEVSDIMKKSVKGWLA